jgi:hypothetical protein
MVALVQFATKLSITSLKGPRCCPLPLQPFVDMLNPKLYMFDCKLNWVSMVFNLVWFTTKCVELVTKIWLQIGHGLSNLVVGT